jgi:hypothetical protein
MKKIKFVLLLMAFSVILLFISCAHQVTPTGGPDDTTGPSLDVSIPGQESVNFPKKGKIIITFSEWISQKSDRGVSIFPPVKASIKVKQNRIEITPQTDLADSTTYHIAINSQLQDLHNNAIRQPFSLTFSTGPTLDSGILKGCVLDPTKKTLQPKIALFRKDHLTKDTGFGGTPDFLQQTDSLGHFELKNLHPGQFYVAAYVDINNDNRIQPLTEAIYLPVDSLITITKETLPITLYPSVYDTTSPRIQSIKPLSARVLAGFWQIPFDKKAGMSIVKITTEQIDTPVTHISTYQPLPDNKSFYILLQKPIHIAPYRLIYTIKTFKGNETDTLIFNGVASTDTIKPSFKSWLPGGTLDLNPAIKLLWDKPIVLNTPLFAIDSLKDTVIFKSQNIFSDSTILTSSKRLKAGSKYRLSILKTMGNDISGNLLKQRDTTDTVTTIMFNVIETDSLCISMQGGAGTGCLNPNSNRKWLFKPLSRTTSYYCQDNGGTFKFDSIPGGKGLIGYFEDLNNNNTADPGSLVPWIAPEPLIMAPDTIEARARWEIEGLTVNICEPCRKQITITPKDTVNAAERKK